MGRKASMGWRSAVRPLCSAVATAAVGTVGCAAAALRRATGPAAPPALPRRTQAPCAGGLRFGGWFRPARHRQLLASFCHPCLACVRFPVAPVPQVSHVALPTAYDGCFPFVFAYFHTCALSYMFSASMCLGSPS